MMQVVVDDKRVMSWLSNMPRNIRRRGNRGMKTWGEHLKDRVLQQGRGVGIKQFKRSRSLFTSTRYIQKQDRGILLMPKSGMYQDRARDHYVTISRKKPMLWAWARQKGFTGKGFMFRKRPFIHDGIRNALKRLMPIMRVNVRAAIKESH